MPGHALPSHLLQVQHRKKSCADNADEQLGASTTRMFLLLLPLLQAMLDDLTNTHQTVCGVDDVHNVRTTLKVITMAENHAEA